ncbi:MAG: ATP-binding protein [Myxococcota bacterium]
MSLPNGIEVQNPGYSLVSEERWGEQVSETRNPALAGMFRDLDLAEKRGTGIRRMREMMRDAGLSMPLFESDRRGKRFVVTFYFHHLLDEADLEWLRQFDGIDDADAQLLVQARNNGRITNREVRAFSGDDTLAASRRLARLCKRGFLDKRGPNKQETFYVLARGNEGVSEPEQGRLFDDGDQIGTTSGPGRDQERPSRDQVATKSRPSRDQVGTRSGPRRTKKDQEGTKSDIGTRSAPSSGTKSPAGTKSGSSPGTRSGPSGDQVGTKSVIGTKSGPASGTKSGPGRDQVGTKSGPSRDQVELLEFASEERSVVEIMDRLGWKHRTKFRNRIIQPLLDAGWLRMTIPDKPRSSKQRYVRTEAGARAVEEGSQ